ncbi:group IIF secretory phospholipase A2-like isoform X2 [Gordionus sp. m RMFG-2023]|uniref:group IIF secretory phospholipase A2-like isoform X2 n=1 Tax=Gordionus sp. m RMFG-2023 TaxID=3053472 RepID=UPI0031FD2DD4
MLGNYSMIIIFVILYESIMIVNNENNFQDQVFSKMFDCLTRNILMFDPATGQKILEHSLLTHFQNYGCHCFPKSTNSETNMTDEADKCCLSRNKCLQRLFLNNPECHYLLDNGVIKEELWVCLDYTTSSLFPTYDIYCEESKNHKCAQERCQCNSCAARCLSNFLISQNNQGILFKKQVCAV